MQLPGLVIPPLTPFRDDLSVDFDILRREIDYIVEDCGAMMVSAAGVETTEYHYLSPSPDYFQCLINRFCVSSGNYCEINSVASCMLLYD